MLVAGSLQNLWSGVLSVLADVVGALIVFLIGTIVAHYIGKLVEQIIKGIQLDKVLAGLGVDQYFHRAGMTLNSAYFFRKFTSWFLVVVFLLAAADILGFYALSNFLREALLYMPNVIVAVLIMLAAVVIGNFVRNLVQASVKSAQLHGAHFLGSMTWWAIAVFGFLTALSQLGIAVTIINSLVTGFVAMLAIAGGIAFGLGGKEYAASLLMKFKDKVEH